MINNMNCNTTNLIYLITCSKCNKKYVGETRRTLKERLNNHRSDIKLKKNTAIAIHFNSFQHNVTQLKITPLEIIPEDKNEYRLEMEKYG